MSNDKYALANLNIDELPVLAGGSLASGDYIVAYDASAGEFVKIDATYFAAA
ncbi:MAG: hypothetical protein ACPGJI_08130 [Kangiellaceae bacterium]